MSVPASYLGIILIWSTTPLAIKWSGDGPGFMFGASARMLIGTVLTLILLRLLRLEIPWHWQALQTYLISSLGIFGALLSIYWAAQYIPSGFISVLFAIAPVLSSIFSAIWLNERSLSAGKLLGILVALSGLIFIFQSAIQIGDHGMQGVAAVLGAVFLFSLSGVWIKRLGADIHAVSVNAGGLLVASVMYGITWFLVDGEWPQTISLKAGASILYLAVIGTTVGFALYMYLLKRLPVATLTLVTLITPVTALMLGQFLNNEIIAPRVWIGVGLISIGLMTHQWGHHLVRVALPRRYNGKS